MTIWMAACFDNTLAREIKPHGDNSQTKKWCFDAENDCVTRCVCSSHITIGDIVWEQHTNLSNDILCESHSLSVHTSVWRCAHATADGEIYSIEHNLICCLAWWLPCSWRALPQCRWRPMAQKEVRVCTRADIRARCWFLAFLYVCPSLLLRCRCCCV